MFFLLFFQNPLAGTGFERIRLIENFGIGTCGSCRQLGVRSTGGSPGRREFTRSICPMPGRGAYDAKAGNSLVIPISSSHGLHDTLLVMTSAMVMSPAEVWACGHCNRNCSATVLADIDFMKQLTSPESVWSPVRARHWRPP